MASMSGPGTFVGMILAAATGLAPRDESPWVNGEWRRLVNGMSRGTPPDTATVVAAIQNGPGAPDFELIPPPRFDAKGLASPPPQRGRTGDDNGQAAAVRGALVDLMRRLSAPVPRAPAPVPVDLDELREHVLARLDPEVTFVEAIRARLRLAPGLPRNVSDPLEPILAAPEFPQPMVEPLSARSQEWILPGLDKVPQDTVLPLLTNWRFVEAYMVGLSHEMGRELLWNEYPTDQRGTYFRQFWRPRKRSEGGVQVDTRDITAIDTWGPTALGTHGGPDRLVLLLRSELLRRYPTAMVYALHRITPRPEERHPIFTGTLNPDVTYLGFDITRDEIERDLNNWTFVIQEQPTEPRFGIVEVPEGDGTTPLKYFNIADMADTAILRGANEDERRRPAAGDEPGTSSLLARWLFRHPVRVLIPASVLLPRQAEARS